jgi:hypothetical protein
LCQTKNASVLKKKIFQLALLAMLTQLFWYCANVGMPTGGAKDETPPVVIRSTPEANALNLSLIHI